MGAHAPVLNTVEHHSSEHRVASGRFELLVVIAIGIAIAWLYFLVWKLRYSAAIREDAVQRSLAVTAGKVHEQLVPYLPEFGFNPKDARFLGSPVDLIVFDGLADGELRRVVFLEVKTGGGARPGRAGPNRRGVPGPEGPAGRAEAPRTPGRRLVRAME